MKKKITAFEFEKFNEIANKVSFSVIKENMIHCNRIDLIPYQRIIRLNIPWGELYCICQEKEWGELYGILKNKGIKIKKWSSIDYFFDIIKPVSYFLIVLLFIVVFFAIYIRNLQK
jgi:hypothetical protein